MAEQSAINSRSILQVEQDRQLRELAKIKPPRVDTLAIVSALLRGQLNMDEAYRNHPVIEKQFQQFVRTPLPPPWRLHLEKMPIQALAAEVAASTEGKSSAFFDHFPASPPSPNEGKVPDDGGEEGKSPNPEASTTSATAGVNVPPTTDGAGHQGTLFTMQSAAGTENSMRSCMGAAGPPTTARHRIRFRNARTGVISEVHPALAYFKEFLDDLWLKIHEQEEALAMEQAALLASRFGPGSGDALDEDGGEKLAAPATSDTEGKAGESGAVGFGGDNASLGTLSRRGSVGSNGGTPSRRGSLLRQSSSLSPASPAVPVMDRRGTYRFSESFESPDGSIASLEGSRTKASSAGVFGGAEGHPIAPAVMDPFEGYYIGEKGAVNRWTGDLEFYSTWREIAGNGDSHVASLTLVYHIADKSFTVTIDCIDDQYDLSHLRTKKGVLVDEDDLFIGSNFEVFGRKITLTNANRTTLDWIEDRAAQYKRAQDAFQTFLEGVSHVPIVKRWHRDAQPHVARPARIRGTINLRRERAAVKRLEDQVEGLFGKDGVTRVYARLNAPPKSTTTGRPKRRRRKKKTNSEDDER